MTVAYKEGQPQDARDLPSIISLNSPNGDSNRLHFTEEKPEARRRNKEAKLHSCETDVGA